MVEYIPLILGVLIGLYVAELTTRKLLHDKMRVAEKNLNEGMESLSTLHNHNTKEMEDIRNKLQTHDGYINSIKKEPLRRKF